MRTKSFSVLVVGAFALGLAGCVGISIGNRAPAQRPTAAPLPISDTGQDAATLAEIDAARQLSTDSNRLRALKQIASRPALSPTAQVHLVNTAYRSLTVDRSRLDLFKTLIASPAFCDPTRQAIVTQLENLSAESSRQAVLDAIHRRMVSH